MDHKTAVMEALSCVRSASLLGKRNQIGRRLRSVATGAFELDEMCMKNRAWMLGQAGVMALVRFLGL